MKRFDLDRAIFFVSFAIFCVVVAHQAYLTGSSGGMFSPVLMCDNQQQELGTVQSNTVVVVPFLLRNGGCRVLAIESVNSACGSGSDLEVQEFSPMTLRSGERRVLSVMFNPCLLEGDVVKKVVIVSNDHRHPQKVLSLRATVIPAPVPPEQGMPTLAPIM